jgi:hypothetical protein
VYKVYLVEASAELIVMSFRRAENSSILAGCWPLVEAKFRIARFAEMRALALSKLCHNRYLSEWFLQMAQRAAFLFRPLGKLHSPRAPFAETPLKDFLAQHTQRLSKQDPDLHA